MKSTEMAALTKVVATIVRDYVTAHVGELVGRVKVLEDRPLPKDGERGPQGEPGATGERGPEGPQGPAGTPGTDGVAGQQGPPGERGADGLNGKDGAPGRDGTLENIKAVYDGQRTVTFMFKDGTPIEGGVLVMPVMLQRGIYLDGRPYEQGDVVTWGGSQWHCNEDTTSKPGEGSKAWTLIVKRGRDGKDGKDAPSLPVVKVGAR